MFVSIMTPATAMAQYRLGTPDTIEMIYEVTGDPQRGCGLRADCQYPDTVIRVEILASRHDRRVSRASWH